MKNKTDKSVMFVLVSKLSDDGIIRLLSKSYDTPSTIAYSSFIIRSLVKLNRTNEDLLLKIADMFPNSCLKEAVKSFTDNIWSWYIVNVPNLIPTNIVLDMSPRCQDEYKAKFFNVYQAIINGESADGIEKARYADYVILLSDKG